MEEEEEGLRLGFGIGNLNHIW